MKKILLPLLVAMSIEIPAFAGISNDDNEPVYMAPIVSASKASSFVPPIPSQRPEAIYLASVCAVSSTYLAQSRANTMAGLAGVLPVESMDRTANPAAWYLIPRDGWQLYDSVTTPFFFWDGQSYQTNNPNIGKEKGGHRIIVNVLLKEAVNKYWCRVTSSSTNIGSAMFNVATNSADQEIRFNLQYVGLAFGENDALESYPNPVTGQWVQVGDDKVFTNGESPSTNSYDFVLRYGATIQNYAATLAGFDGLKGEFASVPQFLKAELIRRDGASDTVVDTYMVTSELPHLSIARDGNNANIKIDQGQKMLVYQVESAVEMNDSPIWTVLHPDGFSVGRPIPEPTMDPQRYFRVKTVTGNSLPTD